MIGIQQLTCAIFSLSQLGHGGFTQIHHPKKVEITVKGRKIRVICTSCGGNFTYALTSERDGNVWAFGCNSDGQCGIGSDKETIVPNPVCGLSKKRILMVSAGFNHGIAMTDNSHQVIFFVFLRMSLDPVY